MLLQNSTDVDAKNKNGDSALILAVNGGHFNIVQMLLQKGAGADFNIMSFQGILILMGSAFHGRFKIIRMLISGDIEGLVVGIIIIFFTSLLLLWRFTGNMRDDRNDDNNKRKKR